MVIILKKKMQNLKKIGHNFINKLWALITRLKIKKVKTKIPTEFAKSYPDANFEIIK